MKCFESAKQSNDNQSSLSAAESQGLRLRDIIEINQSLCDGCGKCLPSCAEGALVIEEGKVKLVDDKLCDGLGACLGQCPQGALKIKSRPARPFDRKAILKADLIKVELKEEKAEGPLTSWPIQLALVSPKSTFLNQKIIVWAADCVSFASPRFHSLFLDKNRPLLIGCPKLDDGELYAAKMGVILRDNLAIEEIWLPVMNLQCCRSQWTIAAEALSRSARQDVILKGWAFTPQGDIVQAKKRL
ncbi:MAG: 4Fe-4S ferredoxin [Deltaproteobacteria bacterium]|jgi:ferredoxin|nr:4Fe-4S ferredoxin [Deltaproteobacteria bacterium]